MSNLRLPIDSNCQNWNIFQLDPRNLDLLSEKMIHAGNSNIILNLNCIGKSGFQLYQLLDMNNNFIRYIFLLDLNILVTLDCIDNCLQCRMLCIDKQINCYFGRIFAYSINFQYKCQKDHNIALFATYNCHIFLIKLYLNSNSQEYHQPAPCLMGGNIARLYILHLDLNKFCFSCSIYILFSFDNFCKYT